MQRLCLFHKIFNLNSPKYVYNKIPHTTPSYATRNNKNIPSFICRTKNFMNSSFPNVINEWNKLDIKITNITSHNTFKSSLLSFIRPLHCDTFGIHNPIGLQLLTRLRTGLSHLNEHKFKHNFRDFLNPLCACNLETEATSYYLLRCHLFQTERRLSWAKLFSNARTTTAIAEVGILIIFFSLRLMRKEKGASLQRNLTTLFLIWNLPAIPVRRVSYF